MSTSVSLGNALAELQWVLDNRLGIEHTTLHVGPERARQLIALDDNGP